MRNFIVTVNGTAYQVGVEEVDGAQTVTSAAPVQATVPTPTPAPAPAAPKAPAAQSVAGEAIKSPMPGVIAKVEVAPGSDVKKGAVLVILEAMKMENEILAPRDAKVKAVQVSKGASVSTGDVLVVLE